MTTEQRIARLDKRIAIFGLYLNAQHSVLSFKYGKDRSLKTLMSTMFDLKSDAMQAQIIATQPIPKFEKGSYAKGGLICSQEEEFINGSGVKNNVNGVKTEMSHKEFISAISKAFNP